VKRKAPRRKHLPPIATAKVPGLVEKKLRTHWGWADNTRHRIEIDAALKGRGKLEAMCHEWLHLTSWAIPEADVRRIARYLTDFLHKNGVRIIEAGDEPLEYGEP
jgi:hypothetical protein